MTDIEKNPNAQSLENLLSRQLRVTDAIVNLQAEKDELNDRVRVALQEYADKGKLLPVLEAYADFFLDEQQRERSFVNQSDYYITVKLPTGHYAVQNSPEGKYGDFVLTPTGVQLPDPRAHAALIAVSKCRLQLFQEVEAQVQDDQSKPQQAGGVALRAAGLGG